MKRVLYLLLAILVAFTFAAGSFALDESDYGDFVQSPELEYEGRIISAWYTPGEALEVLFTPFVNRNILARDARIKIEKAYDELLDMDLSKIYYAVDKVYNGIFINRAVSKIFDLSLSDSTLDRDATFVLGGLDLTHFVCLLHYGRQGWEIVQNATIIGLNLVFSLDNLSPFAIISDIPAEEPASPATGDIFTAVSVCASIALGCGAVYFISRSRKKAEDII